MAGHRWSGWPGAWCLDCGIPDPGEMAIADGWDPTGDDPPPQYDWFCVECPEPNSRRCDPYRDYDVSAAREPQPKKDWMLPVIVGLYAAAFAGVVCAVFRKLSVRNYYGLALLARHRAHAPLLLR